MRSCPWRMWGWMAIGFLVVVLAVVLVTPWWERVGAATSGLRFLQRTIECYAKDRQVYPETLQALVDEHYISSEDLRDSQRHAEFVYRPPAGLEKRDEMLVAKVGWLVLRAHDEGSTEVILPQGTVTSEILGMTAPVFLEELKMKKSLEAVVFREPLRGWVRKEDLPALIRVSDSTVPCASVMLAASSELATGHSTVGREATVMLLGYREGVYPPTLLSTRVNLSRAEREELLAWSRAQVELE